MNTTYDILIVGGGPAGYAAAVAAARNNASVAVFENEHLGGTCLHVGCVPSKYLLDKAHELIKVRKLMATGIFRNTGEFSLAKIQEGKAQVISQLEKGVQHLLESWNITVIQGTGTLVSPHEVSCNGTVYQGKNILIASGSQPVAPPIKGIENALDNTGILSLRSLPKHLVVIGGGVIGLEMASAYAAFGSEITVLEMMEHILPGEDSQLVSLLVNSLKKQQGITVKTGVQVQKLEKSAKGFTLSCKKVEGPTFTVDADIVLSSAGRKANLKGLGIEKLGIALDQKGFIVVDENYMTNVEGVFAAGDVIGGWQLAHAAFAEAELAIGRMLHVEGPSELSEVPRCVYSIPALASVGLTEKQAVERGIEVKTGSYAYRGNSMALAEGEPEGMAKVIVDASSDTVIGVHICGVSAPELISSATLAVNSHLTAAQWSDTITAHPTISEVLHESVLNVTGKSLHAPKKG